MVIETGHNSALCCKSRAGNTEIGNKKDYISWQSKLVLTVLYAVKSRASYTEIGNKKYYISCCDFKFHAILRSSDNVV